MILINTYCSNLSCLLCSLCARLFVLLVVAFDASRWYHVISNVCCSYYGDDVVLGMWPGSIKVR